MTDREARVKFFVLWFLMVVICAVLLVKYANMPYWPEYVKFITPLFVGLGCGMAAAYIVGKACHYD